MTRHYESMSMVEYNLFPRVGAGCPNLLPILLYIFHNYTPEQNHMICEYLIKNKIVGTRLLEVLRSDFKSDLDKMIDWTLKTDTERRFKL